MPVSIKAPRQHDGLVIHPQADQIPSLLARNQQWFRSCSLDILGLSLTDLRQSVRREILGLSRIYFEQLGEPMPDWSGETWIMAGHQPEIFHPGVWIKNFAIQSWARRCRAVPINTVVDNDLAKPPKISIPVGKRLLSVPFDEGFAETPYEETNIQDEALFASFPQRVRELTRDWPFQPMLDAFWERVRACPTSNRGDRLVSGRRALERAWGYQPLELPLSRICQTTAFARFGLYLLENNERFACQYNQAVVAYRKANGIRSRNHPVPELARDGDWRELPFWAWRPGDQRRHHLFVRSIPQGHELRAGPNLQFHLQGSLESRLDQWVQLERHGVKIRTRALTTTLFGRLFIGDLFVHGIGGGKYDEVTDEIIRRFFDVDPPGFAILSATQLLPLPQAADVEAELRDLSRLQRDLHFNPQRYLREPAELIARKREWMGRDGANHAERAERFFQLRHLNDALQPHVAERIREICQRLAATEERCRLHQVQSSREFAFCLFPEGMLRDFFRSRFPLDGSLQQS